MFLGPNLAESLLDISESGISLVIKSALEPGQEISLEIEGHGQVRPVKRTGKVVRCSELAQDKFQVGIEFDNRVAHSDLFNLT